MSTLRDEDTGVIAIFEDPPEEIDDVGDGDTWSGALHLLIGGDWSTRWRQHLADRESLGEEAWCWSLSSRPSVVQVNLGFRCRTP